MIRAASFAALLGAVALGAAGQPLLPNAFPPEEFPTTVTTVVSGDAVRVRVSDGDELVSLYGVSSMAGARDDAASARAFVQRHTEGVAVVVRPLRSIGGMPYVEIVLPSGEVLNQLLLARGLVKLDRLSAADDPTYAAIARQRAAEDADETPEPADSVTSEPPARISLEEFRMRRHLRETAAFEAGMEKWAALPAEYREGVRRHYEIALEAADVHGADLLASLRSDVAMTQGAIESTHSAIQNRRGALELDRERLANDFDLRVHTRLQQQYLADYYADRAAGRHRAARTSRRLADRYGSRAELDRARVHTEYEAVRREHEEAIRGLTAEQRAQAEALRRSNTRLHAARVQTSDRVARLIRALVQLDLFDRAIAEETVPSLPLRHVATIEGLSTERSARFVLDAPVGRVDWYADPRGPGAAFSAAVHSVTDGRPVARFRSTDPPHEAFLLLDAPGEFFVEVETSGPISYMIDVFAIDGTPAGE